MADWADRIRARWGAHAAVAVTGPDPWSVHVAVADPALPEPLVWTAAARTRAGVDVLGSSALARLGRDHAALLRRRPLTARCRGPAVVCAEAAGVLLHECVGHTCEADNYRSYGDRLGIGLGGLWSRAGLTLADDPGLDPWVGSYDRDDEGSPGSRVVLVRDGRWTGLLTDRATAAYSGGVSTGHGRGAPGQPRSGVLDVAAGDRSERQLLATASDGWLLGTPTSGFSAGEHVELWCAWAWRIRGGALEPAARATVVGPLVVRARKVNLVRQIVALGRDRLVNSSAHPCIKDGVEVRCAFVSPALALREVVLEPG
ncbi:MAG: metallopeptidase TldD-related protein [Pseudonocardia sp.]